MREKRAFGGLSYMSEIRFRRVLRHCVGIYRLFQLPHLVLMPAASRLWRHPSHAAPRRTGTLRLINLLVAMLCVWVIPITGSAQIDRLTAESPTSFDSRGRIMMLTPRIAQSMMKDVAWWPVPANTWREARLFQTSASDSSSAALPNIGKSYVAILEVTQNSGAIVRFGLGSAEFDRLRMVFDAGASPAVPGRNSGVVSGVELSQPAGYTFVRNQTFLGLAAYGPATAASLSHSGGASAAGGYFLAAGASFFVSAQMIRSSVVTRSQTILGTHAGFRGGMAGAAVAAIGQADDGPGFGIPILVGALGGTVGGFLAAKNMSDGEAASSGLGADMFALTSLGVSTMTDALQAPKNDSKRKVALGTTVALAGVGYVLGPQYARRASYNVTAGDASVALTTATIGAAAGAAIVNPEGKERTAVGIATAGLLGGFLVSDRLLVRKYDRSSSDAGWVKLGAAAGALMGGGVAFISKAEAQGTLGLLATGGALGLIAADRMIAPARDAGPLRGVLRTSSLAGPSRSEDRVHLMLPSAATAFVLWKSDRRKGPATDTRLRGPLVDMPAVRFVF